LTNNECARETGVLATEAMLDVLPMQYAIRGAVGRLRPYQSNYQIRTAGHAAHSSRHTLKQQEDLISGV
jgi:hypothetical protein